mgnify:CR=1 FL=1
MPCSCASAPSTRLSRHTRSHTLHLMFVCPAEAHIRRVHPRRGSHAHTHTTLDVCMPCSCASTPTTPSSRLTRSHTRHLFSLYAAAEQRRLLHLRRGSHAHTHYTLSLFTLPTHIDPYTTFVAAPTRDHTHHTLLFSYSHTP